MSSFARRRHQPAASPVAFAPGARIEVRGEEWIVRSTRPASDGGVAVHCSGLSELVRNKDAIFLSSLDRIEELRPEETRLVADDSPRFRSARLYIESLLRQSPPVDHRIHLGHRAAMDRADYQLVPAARALQRPRPRILIADAVGLGKTLEVGVLLTELIRRGRGRRILVVALKSVLAQFQQEMWARFTIPLVRLDSLGIERVRAQIPANMNPFYIFDRVIISIDTLKRDEKYRRFLEACHWDAIVIDECQHVAVRSRTRGGRASQRSRLASLLARTCDTLVLTSATPHDGRPESFASLMNLLEPTAIADESDYRREDIEGLFVRRFKKDVAAEVGQAFRERHMALHEREAGPEEQAFFEALAAATFRTIGRQGRTGGVLFATLLLKAFLSSPEAAIETLQQRLRHKALRDPRPGREADALHDTETLEHLVALAEACRGDASVKLDELEQLLYEFGFAEASSTERVVIFAERIATLDMLEGFLERRFGLRAPAVRQFHGTLPDVEQTELVQSFASAKSPVRVLLASDAASEGINLHHFCHRLVHYDIPWSLITLEQRNGRIDRFGQRERPELHYLLTVPTRPDLEGDLRILRVLIDKEQAAHQNLGDAAWIMNLHDPDAEAERIALAIEHKEAPLAVLPDTDLGADDLLAMLLGGAPGTDPSGTGEVEVVDRPTSLFGGDDLAWARSVLDQVIAEEKALDIDPRHATAPPELHEHLDGLSLVAPPDLARRLQHLPPEVRPSDGIFRLTTDRRHVTLSYATARETHSPWPEWQLLWPLHPVAEWLNDRALALFRRHEAPVVRVPSGVAPGAALFVMQGTLSNRRSQPVLVDWFGVHVDDAGQVAPAVEPFDAVVAATGLDRQLANPCTPLETTALEQHRDGVVSRAREHMQALRDQRSQELGASLRDELRRVRAWHDHALDLLDTERGRIESQRALRGDEVQRFEHRRSELDARRDAYERFIDEGLRTVPDAYIRIVAVLVDASR